MFRIAEMNKRGRATKGDKEKSTKPLRTLRKRRLKRLKRFIVGRKGTPPVADLVRGTAHPSHSGRSEEKGGGEEAVMVACKKDSIWRISEKRVRVKITAQSSRTGRK